MRIKRNLVWAARGISCALLFTLVFYYVLQHSAVKEDTYDIEKNKQFIEEKPIVARQKEKKENSLKDWHDHKYIKEDALRKGPGEQGQAYYLPPNFEKEKAKLYKLNGFNARASDDISLNRSISDIRHPKCKNKLYPSVLPKASVVIPFFNEHWSTLFRTVWSAINRSPRELLEEIILVDDGSNKDFLKNDLDVYIEKHFSNVHLIRMPKRKGLITARLTGAETAKGDVLIFLDSHTECSTNWLPPLLAPISQDYKTCVCPFIDVIDYDNFNYRAQDEGARGAFDWNFDYKRLPLLKEDLQNMPEPFKSPVMAGGLFAISAKFFWELGGYDPGLRIWGGEQYELSFKLWQCGGQMVDAPCSRVGHIYRKFVPFGSGGEGDYLSRNYKRVAEVWMDEYAEYIYKHRPHNRHADPGDISEQKKIRQKLNCKSFNWFLQNVAFDLTKTYPPVEPPDYAYGYIKSVADPTLCVDGKYGQHLEVFGLEKCGGGDQTFHLTWHKDIRPGRRNICWDVSTSEFQAPIVLYHCHGLGGNQLWRYDYRSKHVVHGLTKRCLDAKVSTKEVFVSDCNSDSQSQKWVFEHFETERLDHWSEDPLKL